MIYLILDGRIGNQLFMYAYARKLADTNPGQRIVIDDSNVLKRGWDNLLPEYPLEDVEYVHDRSRLLAWPMTGRYALYMLYRLVRRPMNYMRRYGFEKKLKPIFEKAGTYFCQNGYIPFSEQLPKNVLLYGYFQSVKYFEGIENELREAFVPADSDRLESYPGMAMIRDRNSVCISIKVQHNVGDPMYDVCNGGYWRKAIQYIIDNVEDPLFFICSDNVGYVCENLIDTEKYDVVFQSRDRSVSESLAVMGMCKHFVIGNTTYGWWAQYLSGYKDKIVVAPSRWMNVAMPIDIYQDGWHLIEV